MRSLLMTTRLPLPPEDLFPFFADASNLARITPGELGFRILGPQPISMAKGTLIDYRISLWGFPMRWRTRISAWEPPHRFADEQVRGPYRKWLHTHRFESDGQGGTLMTDSVEFSLPLEPFSLVVRPLVEWQLRRIFRYRDGALRRALGLAPTQELPEILFR